MKRRTFLTASAATLFAPTSLLAANGQAYRRGLVEEELAAGKTVFVDFYTDWCVTCRRQGRTVRKLIEANPAYAEAMTFIKVDWDKHAQSRIASRLNIPRRSTLVVLKGDQELGRLVAGTREADIKALLDAGLAAATA